MGIESPGSRIKGSVLIARLNMLRQHGGQARVEEVLKRLPQPDQAVLRKMVLPIAWYPLELNLRLDGAIADALSPDDRTKAFVDMGRASAEALAREGLVEVETDGQFDPHVHEALLSQPSEREEGSVVEVLQKGYRLGDRVLRPARVVVSQGE